LYLDLIKIGQGVLYIESRLDIFESSAGLSVLLYTVTPIARAISTADSTLTMFVVGFRGGKRASRSVRCYPVDKYIIYEQHRSCPFLVRDKMSRSDRGDSKRRGEGKGKLNENETDLAFLSRNAEGERGKASRVARLELAEVETEG
jgi:hypothetical protein